MQGSGGCCSLGGRQGIPTQGVYPGYVGAVVGRVIGSCLGLPGLPGFPGCPGCPPDPGALISIVQDPALLSFLPHRTSESALARSTGPPVITRRRTAMTMAVKDRFVGHVIIMGTTQRIHL